jgi:hypothetical protein
LNSSLGRTIIVFELIWQKFGGALDLCLAHVPPDSDTTARLLQKI